MKFWMVSYHQEGGSDGGKSWHTNKREAERAAAEAVKNHPEEYDGEAPPSVRPVFIAPGRKGMLSFLRGYASHPDNG